jgi:hypothetical protein
MIQKFIYLEWKAFTRSASLGTNLALKIILLLLAIYFVILFLAIGIGGFYMLQERHLDPLIVVNKYLIYYFFISFIIRMMLQEIPVINIRPLLTLSIKKNTIVHFSLGKTILSFFNYSQAFLFVPFTVALLLEGYAISSVLLWHLSIFCLVYCLNFLVILLNNIDKFLIFSLFFIAIILGCQYYNVFDITNYTSIFFTALFQTNFVFLIPFFGLFLLYYITFIFFKKNAYIDAGLSTKESIAKSEKLTWLNQFGVLGTFFKNDIKLIKRNKRSKTTVFMSILFLFYGLLFFNNPQQSQYMAILAGIFVSGGFLFTFGQFVPSWDSAYYSLMMTQNISYKVYLNSKWCLIVIATIISTLLASFYLYYGWQVYLSIVVGAIYNIGVNSHLVLLGGAYTKTPIDLDSSKGAFGDKKAYNLKTMLLSFPKVVLPVVLYAIGIQLVNANFGLLLVALSGILGFAFRNKVFNFIEKTYKKEKYKTIEAYKQKG